MRLRAARAFGDVRATHADTVRGAAWEFLQDAPDGYAAAYWSALEEAAAAAGSRARLRNRPPSIENELPLPDTAEDAAAVLERLQARRADRRQAPQVVTIWARLHGDLASAVRSIPAGGCQVA